MRVSSQLSLLSPPSVGRAGTSCPGRSRFAAVLALCLVLLPGQTDGAVLVDLDATALTDPVLAEWPNRGTLGGVFSSGGTQHPVIVERDGVGGVALVFSAEGTLGTFFIGPVAPDSITGSNSRSVEAWVFNEAAQAEETIIAWGRRGGPDGSNFAFGHGSDPRFGAVLHWGQPDMSWEGAMTVGRWTHVVYTYSSSTTNAVLYRDGRPVVQKQVELNTWRVDSSFQAGPLPMRIGRQSTASGAPSRVGIGECILGRIRVHDVALAPADVASRFAQEAPIYGADDTDGDGLPSWLERRIAGLNPADPEDAAGDLDLDGLSNLDEYSRGTPLLNPDADADGLTDGEEVFRRVGDAPAPTDPLCQDTDRDGLSDSVEVLIGTNPLAADSDGDRFLDGQELAHQSDATDSSSLPVLSLPAAVLDLDAATFASGPPALWRDQGFSGAAFISKSGETFLTFVDDMPAVAISGHESVLEGPPTPEFLAGNRSRSITAWVWNEEAGDEESVVSWGSRGPVEGGNLSFSHGSNPAYGAAGHWGPLDLGWNTNVVQSRWTHIAYTYDSSTARVTVFQDGVPVNVREDVELNTPTIPVGQTSHGLPFRIGGQNEPDGSVSSIGAATILVGRVRIYDGALTASALLAQFTEESDVYGIADLDGDGLPGFYERRYIFLDPANPLDAALDSDADGLSNLTEFRLRTDPSRADTDADGLLDGAEINRRVSNQPAPTDARRADTDGDGLTDAVETQTGGYVSPERTGTDPRVADTDLDGRPDGQEVAWGSDPTVRVSVPEFRHDAPFIELDASELEQGLISSWRSTGLSHAEFRTAEAPADVDEVHGVPAVIFDGLFVHFIGPAVPVFLSEDAPRTVEAWVFNPLVSEEEALISWGLPGRGARANYVFGHGTHPSSGALAHGGDADLSWRPPPTQGEWTHVACSYDPATGGASLYRNGLLLGITRVGPLRTSQFDVNPTSTNHVPIRVGAMNDSAGAASGRGRASMAVARIRIYDQALSGASIALHHESEAPAFIREVIVVSLVFAESGGVELTWAGGQGGRYMVEQSVDLSDWRLVVETSATHHALPAASPGTARFFRVRRP